MPSFTLAEIRDRVRERTDKVGSTFLTDTEINKLISGSYARLYTRIVKAGVSAFEKTQTIVTAGLAASYAVPADYAATLRVDYQNNAGPVRWWTLPESTMQDQPRYESILSPQWAQAFRVVGDGTVGGDKVYLLPIPPNGQTYRHVYVPAPRALTVDGDTLDGVFGFEEWIVMDAAIKVLSKEGGDTTAQLERDRAIISEDIDTQVTLRSQMGHHSVLPWCEQTATYRPNSWGIVPDEDWW